jgi:hypothetical protein
VPYALKPSTGPFFFLNQIKKKKAQPKEPRQWPSGPLFNSQHRRLF